MAGLITELINVLNEQAEYYSELYTLSKEKKDYIIKNDVKSLQAITADEHIVISKNQRLDKKRLEIIRDIAAVLNKKESELTISGLAEMIKNQPEHSSLIQAAEAIRKVAEDLKNANDQNNVLIQNALDYIDFSMNLIRSSAQSAPIMYSRKGEEIDTGRSFFDAKQ